MDNQITETSLLFVEGKNEKYFFGALLKFLKIDNVQHIDTKGADNLKNVFEDYSKQASFNNVSRIAFIQDADKKSAECRLKILKSSVQEIVKARNDNFDFKDISLDSNVKNIEGVNVRYGFYIMPNNKDDGMLEDLLIEYMKTDTICHCVEKYISCAQNNGASLKNKSKSTILAYLSTKPKIPSSIDIAAQQGVFDFNNECFKGIKDFLTKMFSAEFYYRQ
jgi:hypothetical protein